MVSWMLSWKVAISGCLRTMCRHRSSVRRIATSPCDRTIINLRCFLDSQSDRFCDGWLTGSNRQEPVSRLVQEGNTLNSIRPELALNLLRLHHHEVDRLGDGNVRMPVGQRHSQHVLPDLEVRGVQGKVLRLLPSGVIAVMDAIYRNRTPSQIDLLCWNWPLPCLGYGL